MLGLLLFLLPALLAPGARTGALLIYVLAAWLLLIGGAALLSRRLGRDDEERGG